MSYKCLLLSVAGHSMGGHGAWHLATHYPDMALAVLSVAGWIRKEDYGDSNLFFRYFAFIGCFLSCLDTA